MSPLLLLLACATSPDPSTETEAGTASETQASASDTEVDTEVDVAVSDVAWTASDGVVTVGTLTFTTSESVTVTVGHGEDWSTTSTGTSHEVLVLGLPADAASEVRVELDGVVLHTEEVQTDPLPSGLPTPTMDGDPDSAPPFLLVPVVGSSNAAVVLDRQGRVVWYLAVEPERPLVRALVNPDGSGIVVCLAMGGEDPSTGAVRWVDWHGETQREAELAGLRMDAVVLPDGTVTAITAAEHPDYDALGDALVELSPDGETTEVWNTWEAMDPVGDDVASIEAGEDWTHANALEYDPESDDYFLTLGAYSEVKRIDRATGETEWTLFGTRGDFAVDSQPMLGIHHLDFTEQGLVIFNNGTPERGYSRVVEFTLDEEGRTATEYWEHVPDPELWVYVKGDVHRLDTGDTLIVWSSSGQLQIVSEDSEVRWQVDVDLGHVVLFSEVLDGLGG